MSPDARISQLEQQVRDLQSIVLQLQSVNTITPEFKQVLDRGVVSASGKAADAENVFIVESGSDSHTVLGLPDGFKSIGGYNFPYYL